MKTLLAIWLDAFRVDYVNKSITPFMYELSQRGLVGEYEPLLAFEGLGVSIVTGVSPLKHGIWTQFCFNPKDSPFRWTNKASKISTFFDIFTDKTSGIGRLGRASLDILISMISKRISGRTSLATAPMIPVRNLHFFDTALTTALHNENALPIPTLFDILRKYDISFEVVSGFRDEVVFKKAMQFDDEAKLVFLHLVDLDTTGHNMGPCSERTYGLLHETDYRIMKMIKKYQKNLDINIFIFSDHGMINVKRTVNILHQLNKSGLKESKDFIVFLDSTIARFWTQNEKCKRRIVEVLHRTQGGRILSQDDLEHYQIPNDRKYGDIIWLADPGTLIIPNYYQGMKTAKGMHGYAPGPRDLMSPIIIYGEDLPSGKIQRRATPTDILPTMLDLLNVSIPENIDGHSLFS